MFALWPHSVRGYLGNMLTFCFGNIVYFSLHRVYSAGMCMRILYRIGMRVECVICIQYRFRKTIAILTLQTRYVQTQALLCPWADWRFTFDMSQVLVMCWLWPLVVSHVCFVYPLSQHTQQIIIMSAPMRH